MNNIVNNTFTNIFPPPHFLTMPAVGLDISDRRVRFIELKSAHDRFIVLRYGESEIPDNAIISGKLKQPEELKKTLTALKEKYKLQFVRVSLPEERAYLVKMVVPNVDTSELREAIMFQLEEHVPVPPSEAVFDYHIIRDLPEKNSVEVAVSVLSAKEVEEYASIFEGTGMIPSAFEIEAQAIAEAVINKEEKNIENTVMVIDFGRTRTGISIVSGGIVRFTSTIDIGSYMITKALEKYFSVDSKEARKIKNKHGLTKSAKDKEFFLATMSTIAILRDEINKLYIYWHTHRGDKKEKIQRLILCGGGSNLRGLPEYLSASLHVRVSLANPWVNVNSFNKFIPDIPLNESFGYTTAIGLALQSIRNR